MDRQRDLELILRSRIPVVVIETGDESGTLEILKSIALSRARDGYVPLFRWSVTDGLQRLDIALEPQRHNAEPTEALKHIRAVESAGIYVMLDFHPYLEDPVNVRLIKDICLGFETTPRQLVIVSHKVSVPSELESFCARFEMALPGEIERKTIIKRVAAEYSADNPGSRVSVDPKAYRLLIRNLAGLTDRDTENLARNAIYQDGAITRSDLPAVMQAKYELLDKSGILHFEYDTAHFGEIGGAKQLKEWLKLRKPVFAGELTSGQLDTPKGILLIGVQGCGKSLAAKATAGVFGLPLLRLDFANLYNKYHGETEKNLKDSLQTANVMAPCVLWIDEIEKGLAGRGGETGTTQRILGSFLTWMSEKAAQVFVVATANDISALPPELVRKGRFDEIFFVDLPKRECRAEIFAIHLVNRDQPADSFDLNLLADETEGFSGAEIEQAIVSALYLAHAQTAALATHHISAEIRRTKPLSVVMAEQIDLLRRWAEGRTVNAD